MATQQPQQPQGPFDHTTPAGMAGQPPRFSAIPAVPARKSRRLPIILGAVGIFLFLCVGIVVVAALAGGGDAAATPAVAASTPAATSIPAVAGGPTKAATTPAPAGKWSEPGKGKILFGSDFRTAKAGGLEVLDTRADFKLGTELRMVAQFKEKAGATELEIILSRVTAGGAESVVEKAKIDLSSPDSNYYSTTLGTDTLEVGTYKIKYVRGGATVLAEGQFTLAATAGQVR